MVEIRNFRKIMKKLRGMAQVRSIVPCLLLVSAMPAYAQGSRRHLLMTPARISFAQKQAHADKARAEVWNRILQVAQTNDKRKDLAKADYVALAYMVTQEDAYAQQLKAILQKTIQAKTWGVSEMLLRQPAWHSELNMAHNAMKAALAYDAIYDKLTPSERKTIAKGFYRLALQPLAEDWIDEGTRIHSLNSMGHNWWASCISMAGVLAIAIHNEIPEACSLLPQVDKSLQAWFAFKGDVLQNKPQTFDEGGTYEGINYTGYGIQEALLFYLSYENSGLCKQPVRMKVFEQIPDFFLQTCYPRSKGTLYTVNFGDSYRTNTGRNCMMLLASMGIRNKDIAWYLSQITEAGAEDYALDTPMGWLYTPDLSQAPKVIAVPKSHLYGKMGWATMRDSWDKDATALCVKSGNTWNHAHADAASFILYHHGEDLLKDAGKCWYKKSEYRNYFFQSEAHNVVLFDGKGQPRSQQYYSAPLSGSLHHLIDGESIKYVLADGTGPNADRFSRYFRHFLWIGKTVLVIDDLKTHETGTFQWVWHPGGKAVKRGTDLQITNGEASFVLRPLFPEMLAPSDFLQDYPNNMYWQTYQAKTEGLKGDEEYWTFHLPKTTDQVKGVTAILLKDTPTDTQLPQIERLEGKNWISVKITEGEKVHYVYINQQADGRLMHLNSWMTVNGLQTDAYMTVLTYSKKTVEACLAKGDEAAMPLPSDYLMIYGSCLRRNGKCLFSSLDKKNVLSEQGKVTKFEVN